MKVNEMAQPRKTHPRAVCPVCENICTNVKVTKRLYLI